MSSAAPPALKSRFDVAVAALLRSEGGLVDDPSDGGGITNFGISLRFLVAEGKLAPNRALCDVNRDGRVDGRDIRALTPAAATELYRRIFWVGCTIQTLPPPLDAMMLDQCVNMGSGTAIALLQHAAGIDATTGRLDGATDAQIARVVGRLGMPALVAAYKAAARAHYAAIIAVNPKLARYRTGWLARVDRLGSV